MERVQQWKRFSVFWILRGRGEGREERVVVVAVLDPVTPTVGALDVEEGTVECAELFWGVVCSWREVLKVLTSLLCGDN
jgi:hypothetical protein